MVTRLFAALVLSCLAGLATLADDAKQDLDKLKGNWMLTALEMNGEKAPKDLTDRITVSFEGDKMKVTGVGGDQADANPEFTIKLDPSKKPKALDATALNGRNKGKTDLGIYEVNGDELKLCMPNDEVKDRPKDFKSPQGANVVNMTLKRKK